MGIREDLEAEERKLRGIRRPKGEGAGHHFKTSRLMRKARGEDVEAEEAARRAELDRDL